MKKIIILILMLSSAISLSAQMKRVKVDARVDRSGSYLKVDMDLNLRKLRVPNNKASLITPWLINGRDSLELSSIGVYGRQRHFYYLRNFNGSITGETETVFLSKDKPDTLSYNEVVPFEPWMEGAVLKVCRNDYGCCHLITHHSEGIYALAPFFPELLYVQPPADTVKIRYVEGTAYVDFPVSKTTIYPEYRNNIVELGKINASIDEVRQNQGVTIQKIGLKGFASPESPYSNNTRLAAGRTEAIKQYILQLHDFQPESITTDSEPENWEGLREYVKGSNLKHKDEIIARIDGDQKPDDKEAGIRKDFPEDYAHLLKFCYPALRRTDYKIEYQVVIYSDVKIIKEVMAKAPKNLSQNEFYLLAETYEPGSPEFIKVFETAVLMFPDDPVANLNAANIEMSRGNLDLAKAHLAKAGDSAEVSYAKGVYHFLKGEYLTSLAYLLDASQRGVKASEETIKMINLITKYQYNSLTSNNPLL